jgi:RimJ/RimL family protein N-acetyltransferase
MGLQKLYSSIDKSNVSSIHLRESIGFGKEFIHENQQIYSIMI